MPPEKDTYLEAKELLVKGKRLTKSIALFEKSSYPERSFLLLCACVGRLASIAFATQEAEAYSVEKANLELKKKKNPEIEISLSPVRTPDDGKEFDLSSPAVANEIHSLVQKILSCSSSIDKTLSEAKEPKDTEEYLKNLHLYISALVLLNRTLPLLPGKFTQNKALTESCTTKKIIASIDSFLGLKPSSNSLLYLKALVQTLPLIHISSPRDQFAFSLGDSSKLNLDRKDLTESISYLDTVIRKSPRTREAILYKSLLLYFLDKSKSAEELDKFIHYNSSSSILHLLKSELIFQTEKGDPFEPLRQANASPILGDFSFSLPIRFEIKNCFGYLRWTSGLVLSRSLAALYAYAQSYFTGIKPEALDREHLIQLETLFNFGIRILDSFQKQAPSSYQDIVLRRGTMLMGIVNIYNAWETVKKAKQLAYSKEKSDFLEKYAETLEYVKKIDAQLTG